MAESRLGRWAGEFVVIVLGVLVALGVDDWRQYRADRATESELIDRLGSDLIADGVDLARAYSMVTRRYWTLESLRAAVDSGPPPLETFLEGFYVDFRGTTLAAARRRSAQPWDSIARPLETFVGLPEFDLSDDSYQEMLTTGVFDAIRDAELRAAILAYYRTAEDFRSSFVTAGDYQARFEEALATVDAAIGDPIPLSEIASRASGNRPFQVEVRHARMRTLLQLRFLSIVERARQSLEDMIAPTAGVAG